jgi:hypothetical protein
MHAMEALGGEVIELLFVLVLGTRREVSGPRYAEAALPPRKNDPHPGTHWLGGWVGPRAGLDAQVRRKTLCPLRG